MGLDNSRLHSAEVVVLVYFTAGRTAGEESEDIVNGVDQVPVYISLTLAFPSFFRVYLLDLERFLNRMAEKLAPSVFLSEEQATNRSSVTAKVTKFQDLHGYLKKKSRHDRWQKR